MPEFAQVGDFCPNAECFDCGKLQSEQAKKNIKKFGKTEAGRQRYQCTTCDGTFTETKGTIFYRRRTAESEIIDILALVAEGSRISSLARANRATATWEDVYYNLGRPLKTLRLQLFDDPHCRWLPRTPAMAAGLTDHVWTAKDVKYTCPLRLATLKRETTISFLVEH